MAARRPPVAARRRADQPLLEIFEEPDVARWVRDRGLDCFGIAFDRAPVGGGSWHRQQREPEDEPARGADRAE
jgi:hypothetical protein